MSRPNLVVLIAIVMSSVPALVYAAEAPQWLRDPALSPDGTRIAFRRDGDIYVASVASGKSQILRGTSAHEMSPVWLADGNRIAFAADTHGSYDVFMVNADGTPEPQRLTWHSRDEVPIGASPDGTSLLIRSGRLDLSTSRGVYPMPFYDSEDNSQSSPWTSLFSLPLAGGLPVLLVEPSSLAGAWDANAGGLVFSFRPGNESIYRKHERSPATQDIWLRDRAGTAFRKLTSFEGSDTTPVWSAADGLIYFLSDRSGSLNVWRMPAEGDARAEQVSKHTLHPVSGLSASRAGLLSYSYRGQLWLGTPGSGFRPLAITMPKTAVSMQAPGRRDLSAFIRQAVLAPEGSESVVIARGQVYALDRAGHQRSLFVDQPGTKSWPSLSADGRRLLVVRDQGFASDLLLAELPAASESWLDTRVSPRITTFAATRSEVILRSALSPDGTQAAYTTGMALRTVALNGGQPRTLLTRAQGLGGADQPFDWHPSGKYLALQWQAFHRMTSEIAVLSVTDAAVVNISRSGFDDTAPQWSRDGRALFWSGDRDGLRNFGGNGETTDAYALFIAPTARLAFEKRQVQSQLPARESEVDPWLAALRSQPDEPVQERVRLTPSSATTLAATIAPSGRFTLRLQSEGDGSAVWRVPLPDGEPTRVAQLMSRCDASTGFASVESMHIRNDEREALVLAGCRTYWIDLATGQATALSIKDVTATDAAEEQRWVFEHVVRTNDRVYYRPERLPALQWPKHVAEYRRYLPAIRDPRDFAEVMNELLGELDASHTHFHFVRGAARERSGSIGVIYDPNHAEAGWRIAEVMPGSPLARSAASVRSGDVITAIDGAVIPRHSDPAQLLLGTVGKQIALTITAASGDARFVRVEPIDNEAEAALAYQRWVAWQRRLTEQLSGGALGYVHMAAMDEGEFRGLLENVLGGLANKQGLVFDTRFNIGGWMHEPLLALFSAPHAFDLRANGAIYASEPALRVGRPFVMLVNQANYSNGSEIPRLFHERGLAKLVGETIPGSGLGWFDAAMPFWEHYYAIAHDASLTAEGQYWEGVTQAPDIQVAADWVALRAGRDVQLEAAVESLLEDLGRSTR